MHSMKILNSENKLNLKFNIVNITIILIVLFIICYGIYAVSFHSKNSIKASDSGSLDEITILATDKPSFLLNDLHEGDKIISTDGKTDESKISKINIIRRNEYADMVTFSMILDLETEKYGDKIFFKNVELIPGKFIEFSTADVQLSGIIEKIHDKTNNSISDSSIKNDLTTVKVEAETKSPILNSIHEGDKIKNADGEIEESSSRISKIDIIRKNEYADTVIFDLTLDLETKRFEDTIYFNSYELILGRWIDFSTADVQLSGTIKGIGNETNGDKFQNDTVLLRIEAEEKSAAVDKLEEGDKIKNPKTGLFFDDSRISDINILSKDYYSDKTQISFLLERPAQADDNSTLIPGKFIEITTEDVSFYGLIRSVNEKKKNYQYENKTILIRHREMETEHFNSIKEGSEEQISKDIFAHLKNKKYTPGDNGNFDKSYCDFELDVGCVYINDSCLFNRQPVEIGEYITFNMEDFILAGTIVKIE
jgi:hypothetical protein